jgi:hypothetical protein
VWTRGEAAAAEWLGDHSTAADVVMASTNFANPLAGDIDGRVVHGHIVATLRSDDKAAEVAAFYAPSATVAERSRLLAETGATLVALGPSERALGGTDLSQQPELSLVYDQAGVEFLRVNR